MKSDTMEAEKLSELLKKADNHPMMQKILAEAAAAVMTKRTEAAERIEALTRERGEIIPKLRADLETKEANYKTAKAALDAAEGEFKTARAALSNRGQSFDREIGQHEQILIESADPAIDAAIAFFNEKLAYLRAPGRISRRSLGAENNLIAWKKTVKEESNAAAVRSALTYCQAAIKELERMKLSPSLDMKKVEKMKTSIPEIEIYTEVTGEKPLERVDADPRSLFPSDSELDWRLDKLMEKGRQILARP